MKKNEERKKFIEMSKRHELCLTHRRGVFVPQKEPKRQKEGNAQENVQPEDGVKYAAEEGEGAEKKPDAKDGIKGTATYADAQVESDAPLPSADAEKLVTSDAFLTEESRNALPVVELDLAEIKGNAIKLIGCTDCRYHFPAEAGLLLIHMDHCTNVFVTVDDKLLCSTVEIYASARVHVVLDAFLGMLQVDDCLTDVCVYYAEKDHIGTILHQNSPGISVEWPGTARVQFGNNVEAQYITKPSPDDSEVPLQTVPVLRGEGDMIMNNMSAGAPPTADEVFLQRTTETASVSEEEKAKALKEAADKDCEEGNSLFRASDFMQAAMKYTLVLQNDPNHVRSLCNRSMCFIKLNEFEKAHTDALSCLEVDPKNPKAWFRKGFSLQQMKRYREAIEALVQAEKLEPNNLQVQQAIKFSQMAARKEQAN